jgi:hypothetical protein
MTAVRDEKAASLRRPFGLLALPLSHLSLICTLRGCVLCRTAAIQPRIRVQASSLCFCSIRRDTRSMALI